MADEVARRLKELHDQLVAGQPAGEHNAATCAQCATQEGVPVGKTYTEDELRAQVDVAVSQAVGDLRTQLADLQASQEAAAIEERIRTAVEAATGPLQTQVTELQSQLDAAKLETAAAVTRAETAEAAVAEAARATEVASRRDARLAKVKEAAPGFDQAYLDANAQRWAEMAEEDFAERLVEYAAISGATPSDDGPPTTSALQATTGDQGAAGRQQPKSPRTELAKLRRQGIDVRTI